MRDENGMVQMILDTYFAEYKLKAADIDEIDAQGYTIPFPKSPKCDCKICGTPWITHIPTGRSIAVTTTTGNRHMVYIPASGDLYKHEW